MCGMPAPLSYLLVDGHSVMHAWPELRRHQVMAGKRHVARADLLQRLRHYQDMKGGQVVVVFDGTQSQMTEVREKAGLQIIYADSGSSADHILEKIAAKYGKLLLVRVVSADVMVGETVMAFGADWLSPEMLKLMCDDAEKDMRGHIAKLTSRRHLLAWLGLSGASLGLPAWAKQSGASLLKSSAIAAAARYSSERRGYALLIQQHGQVVHESYANGGKRGQARRIYSGTKGFWGFAAMAAVEDGLISLNEKVAGTIHEWRSDDRKSKITVEHLLDFTGGLERCQILHEDGLKDRNQMAIQRPLLAAPGKSFIYGPSQLQVFHELLKRKLRKQKETPTHYLERRVLSPLGLGPQRYLPDAAGNPLMDAGFLMTVGQWARLGELLLRKGAPVLKPDSFHAMIEGSAANASYSFGFWNNRAAGRISPREIDIENQLNLVWNKQSWSRVCICKNAPTDLIACIGSSYQRLYAIPSRGLVVVRQGLNANYSDGDFLRTLLGG
jgi:CubicO group peptidase (beta-lactamase class C family)/predicted RNA-binding protein with PIN domain